MLIIEDVQIESGKELEKEDEACAPETLCDARGNHHKNEIKHVDVMRKDVDLCEIDLSSLLCQCVPAK